MLLILDGWGYRENGADNAIAMTATPNWDRLLQHCPRTRLETSGEAVGLPAGQMGNSEVGHMNIGAGRIVYQDLTKISRAFARGELNKHPLLTGMAAELAGSGGAVHVMGLLSPGGVHSHEEHLFAMIRLLAAMHIKRIAVHAFLDGRDTPPRSAQASIQRLQAVVDDIPQAQIATVSGRFYAMDRDQRWERTHSAYQAIVEAQAESHAESAAQALSLAYENNLGDEFVAPTVIDNGCAVADGDAIVFINFRADRARQLSRALTEPGFDGFKARRPRLQSYITMTEYLAALPARVLFPPQRLPRLLGEELARAGLKQLRIAETEKYAHVTFFFNGGEEQANEGEERILIPSPKVHTYDLKPEMSAPELTAKLLEAIASDNYDVIICNVANPDMVGHTGIFSAAQDAVRAVDQLLGQVSQAIADQGGELLITADHGNIEQMLDPDTQQPHTAHTTNPVPFVFMGRDVAVKGGGSLRDIAPTMLHLLGLPQPPEMSGASLFVLTGRARDAA